MRSRNLDCAFIWLAFWLTESEAIVSAIGKGWFKGQALQARLRQACSVESSNTIRKTTMPHRQGRSELGSAGLTLAGSLSKLEPQSPSEALADNPRLRKHDAHHVISYTNHKTNRLYSTTPNVSIIGSRSLRRSGKLMNLTSWRPAACHHQHLASFDFFV